MPGEATLSTMAHRVSRALPEPLPPLHPSLQKRGNKESPFPQPGRESG